MRPQSHNSGSVRAAALAFNESGSQRGLFVAGLYAVSALCEARLWPVLPPLSALGITALPVTVTASRKATSNAKRILSKKYEHAGGNG